MNDIYLLYQIVNLKTKKSYMIFNTFESYLIFYLIFMQLNQIQFVLLALWFRLIQCWLFLAPRATYLSI